MRSGIDSGTQVITVGRNAVRDGTAVQVINEQPSAVVAAQPVNGAEG